MSDFCTPASERAVHTHTFTHIHTIRLKKDMHVWNPFLLLLPLVVATTGLEFGKSQRAVENREKWRKLVAKSSVVPQRPWRLRDWWWWWVATIISWLFWCWYVLSVSSSSSSSISYPQKVVGAAQMISQPVSSIFLCSPKPSGTCQTPGLSIPWCCLPTSSSVRLVFFPLCKMVLARPNEWEHDHTTAVCVSLWWSGLCVVWMPAGSWHGLPRW